MLRRGRAKAVKGKGVIMEAKNKLTMDEGYSQLLVEMLTWSEGQKDFIERSASGILSDGIEWCFLKLVGNQLYISETLDIHQNLETILGMAMNLSLDNHSSFDEEEEQEEEQEQTGREYDEEDASVDTDLDDNEEIDISGMFLTPSPQVIPRETKKVTFVSNLDTPYKPNQTTSSPMIYYSSTTNFDTSQPSQIMQKPKPASLSISALTNNFASPLPTRIIQRPIPSTSLHPSFSTDKRDSARHKQPREKSSAKISGPMKK